MGELELVGLHDDGEHLVLLGPDGQRFRLRIDEPLRAAVRRDRPQLEQLRAERASSLTPREIQARIRAGATAVEVAHSAGLPVEAVRRYEGPVLAEREYIAEQARAARVGHESGAPALGDLVADRLAARGIDVSALSWDAAREPSGPWVVLARFQVGGEPREARWGYEQSSRALTALEDEARWLSETELDEPAGRRHLAAVRDVVFDLRRTEPDISTGAAVEIDAPVEEPSASVDRTGALLDELGSRRGRRQPVSYDEDGEEFEGFGPQRAFDLSHLAGRPDQPAPPPEADDRPEAPHEPAGERPRAETPPAQAVPDVPVDEPDDAVVGADRPRRRGRAKVPSWDEIVFGARPE
jgi:hypothetical protein